MPLIPYRHFENLDRWFDDEWPDIWERAGHWLPKVSRGLFLNTPRVNVYEEKGNIVADIEMPGIDPEKIDLEVEENIIKIEAKTEEAKEEKDKGYFRKEMSREYYKRVIPLPMKVDEKKAEASYEKGVLKVVIPKLEKQGEPEKKVKVKVKAK